MKVNFNSVTGKMKPMHATNNGPYARTSDIEAGNLHPFTSNFEEYRAAGIPYARMHDSSFYHRFGLEHSVDVYYLFPNFDSDPEDPESYDFACTDEYLKCCVLAGTKIFFRLGHRIEHEVKRYGTLPPKDLKKWAIVCEHIIRHYNEGWANGFNFNIEYWEIWNEPDLHWNTGIQSPTWSGTREEYFELYHITATHLKSCFPHLKIGGPALAYDLEWAEAFLAQLKAPLDFFSWHTYKSKVEPMLKISSSIRALLDKYGFTKAESILDEWNYVRSWANDDIVYSHDQRGKIKGASFSVAVMCAGQYSSTDMLMYYDARPNEFWNGMFDDTVIGRILKGYYPFPMFDKLYRLGSCCEVTASEEGAYICAAKNDNEAAVLVTHFNDDDSTKPQKFTIELCGFGSECGTELELYLLDESHNVESVLSLTYFGERFDLTLDLPNFTSYLIKMKKKQGAS